MCKTDKMTDRQTDRQIATDRVKEQDRTNQMMPNMLVPGVSPKRESD